MNWPERAAIDQKLLSSHIFEFDRDKGHKLEIKNYEIQIDEDGVRRRTEFISYLKNQTPHFIFSEQKQKEIRENGAWPYDKASRKIGDILNKSDGFYGELILFLIMDGFFDFPLVSHKMAIKDDYNTQVKGADGLYIGALDGKDYIGYGEAKFYQRKPSALDDAVEGISEFHGIEGIDEVEAELDVAREAINPDLDKEELREIIDRTLKAGSTMPILHPVLIAYEGGDYEKVRRESKSKQQSIELIGEFHGREQFLELVERRIEKYPELEQIQLLVFFLRVEDTQKFKDDLEAII